MIKYKVIGWTQKFLFQSEKFTDVKVRTEEENREADSCVCSSVFNFFYGIGCGGEYIFSADECRAASLQTQTSGNSIKQ